LISRKTIPIIENNSFEVVMIDWAYNKSYNIIYISVDPFNEVIELDELNNIDFRCVNVTINPTFSIIDGNEIVLLRDINYIISSNIQVTDNSNLVIRNTTFTDDLNSYNLIIKNNAKLFSDNSIFNIEKVISEDQSELFLKDSVISTKNFSIISEKIYSNNLSVTVQSLNGINGSGGNPPVPGTDGQDSSIIINATFINLFNSFFKCIGGKGGYGGSGSHAVNGANGGMGGYSNGLIYSVNDIVLENNRFTFRSGNAGDGGKGDPGGNGGKGGDIAFTIISKKDILNDNTNYNLQCGEGGDGGQGSNSQSADDGGNGGNGGNLDFDIICDICDINNSIFYLLSGNGENGGYGGDGSSNGGDGGIGGEGGFSDLRIISESLFLKNSDIDVVSNEGEDGGDGGRGSDNDGGNGNLGGNAHPASIKIITNNTMILKKSYITSYGGQGGQGGEGGWAGDDGGDGSHAGDGGQSLMNLNSNKKILINNSFLNVRGGYGNDGGDGGNGDDDGGDAGHGADGAEGYLEISSNNILIINGSSLKCTGGFGDHGGDGEDGDGTSGVGGNGGNGGNGAQGNIQILNNENITISFSNIECNGGSGSYGDSGGDGSDNSGGNGGHAGTSALGKINIRSYSNISIDNSTILCNGGNGGRGGNGGDAEDDCNGVSYGNAGTGTAGSLSILTILATNYVTLFNTTTSVLGGKGGDGDQPGDCDLCNNPNYPTPGKSGGVGNFTILSDKEVQLKNCQLFCYGGYGGYGGSGGDAQDSGDDGSPGAVGGIGNLGMLYISTKDFVTENSSLTSIGGYGGNGGRGGRGDGSPGGRNGGVGGKGGNGKILLNIKNQKIILNSIINATGGNGGKGGNGGSDNTGSGDGGNGANGGNGGSGDLKIKTNLTYINITELLVNGGIGGLPGLGVEGGSDGVNGANGSEYLTFVSNYIYSIDSNINTDIYFDGKADFINLSTPSIHATGINFINIYWWLKINCYDQNSYQLHNAEINVYNQSDIFQKNKKTDINGKAKLYLLSEKLNKSEVKQADPYKINATHIFNNQPFVSSTESLTINSNKELDLTINDVWTDFEIVSDYIQFIPEQPRGGNNMTITAIIKNIGRSNASLVNVTFYDNDPYGDNTIISNEIIEFLSYGQNNTLSVNWSPVNDIHYICVDIDPDNNIKEYNELNNIAFTSPDLSISDEDIFFSKNGSKLFVNAIIKNYGETAVNNFIVSFYKEDPNNDGRLIKHNAITELINQKNGYTTTQIMLNTSEFIEGDLDIYVLIDPCNKIFESNESNNLAHNVFIVNLTQVTLIPEEDTVYNSEMFNVSVYIDPTVAIGGWSFDIQFPSDKLLVNNLTPGPYWNTFFDGGDIDNINGTIKNIQSWTVEPYPDSNNTAFIISFSAKDIGITDIGFIQVEVTDSDFNPLDVILFNSSVEILTILEIFNQYPIDGAINVERPPTDLNVTIDYSLTDGLDIFIKWKNHNNEWEVLIPFYDVGYGNYGYVPSGNDWIWGDTNYIWSVNVSYGSLWINETYTFTTGCSRYDVSNNDVVNFQDAGLCWVNRDSVVPYDGLYDVNQDKTVNFQDAGLCWVNRD